MATWDEIRDEIAGMLADGQPLEDVIAKLEERKNEMAKANLLKMMDEMKKRDMTNDITILSCPICYNPKLREYGNDIYWCDVCETYVDKNGNIVLTEQNWLQTCTTEQLAEALFNFAFMCSYCGDEAHSTKEKIQQCHFGKCCCQRQDWVEWLKQPHIHLKNGKK